MKGKQINIKDTVQTVGANTDLLTNKMTNEFVSMKAAEQFGTNFVLLIICLTVIIIGGGGLIAWLVKAIGDSVKTSQKMIDVISEGQKEGFKEITQSIEKVGNKVGLPFLTKEIVFKIVSNTFESHIYKKLDICRKILEANHLRERRSEIEKILRQRFIDITTGECRDLNMYNTQIGCIGNIILESINFDNLMDEIYLVFFSDSEIEIKLRDLETTMKHYVEMIMNYIEIQYTIMNKQSFCEG